MGEPDGAVVARVGEPVVGEPVANVGELVTFASVGDLVVGEPVAKVGD